MNDAGDDVQWQLQRALPPPTFILFSPAHRWTASAVPQPLPAITCTCVWETGGAAVVVDGRGWADGVLQAAAAAAAAAAIKHGTHLVGANVAMRKRHHICRQRLQSGKNKCPPRYINGEQRNYAGSFRCGCAEAAAASVQRGSNSGRVEAKGLEDGGEVAGE